MKRNILKTVKTAFVIGLLNTSLAFATPIKNIEILGLNAISRGTVLSYLPVEVGDDYGATTSTQIIQSLYKTQFFKDIKVVQNDKTLQIVLTENPHIKYVDFLNNSENVVDEDTLKKILISMDIVQGKIFNKKQLHSLIEQVKAAYIAKGYYNVEITENIDIDEQNRVGIEFDISEGEVARIKSMRITGSKVETEEDLLDLFEIGEADWWFFNYFTEKDHYSKIALDAGIEALKSHYINLGYLDFKLTDVQSILTADKGSINISIQVSEGGKYKIGTIGFSGETLNESEASLTELLTVSEGDLFRRQKIINSIQAVTDIYSNQGYAFTQVDVATNEDEVTHAVDLDFKIMPRDKVYVNRITIVGNTRTQDEVVRREIGIYEGGLYSDIELKESIAKIKRLGYFSDVQMSVAKVPDFEDRINLNFTVEETKTGNFSIGLSHSNNSGSSFEIGVSEKNFLGTGNTLNASVSQSSAVKKADVYFVDPYFTEDKHSLSYGVFFKKTDGAKLELASYKINEKGGSVGYGVPMTKDTRINTDLRLSTKDITCGKTFAAEYEKAQCASNDKTEAKLSLEWSSNTLDDYNFPTEGSASSLNLGVALPIADFRYYKFNISAKDYFPINKDLTFKMNSSVSIAQGYGGKELPFFERYYGGGSSSVRGYDFNSLGAKYSNDKAKGGELSILMGVSVISPLKFIKDSKNMRLSAFFDAGGVSREISNPQKNDFRASVGVAFSWLTPIGPLGVYVAQPLLKKEGDKTKTFEFTIGTSF